MWTSLAWLLGNFDLMQLVMRESIFNLDFASSIHQYLCALMDWKFLPAQCTLPT
jgi:hypothetical protein